MLRLMRNIPKSQTIAFWTLFKHIQLFQYIATDSDTYKISSIKLGNIYFNFTNSRCTGIVTQSLFLVRSYKHYALLVKLLYLITHMYMYRVKTHVSHLNEKETRKKYDFTLSLIQQVELAWWVKFVNKINFSCSKTKFTPLC